MNRKITLDLLILISSLTGLILSYLYQEDGVKRDSSLLLLGLVFLGSLGVVALDRRKWAGVQERKGEKGITQLLLLGEEQKYRVSSKEPCRVERGDIIYIGLAPVKLR